mmetsp:Transcript_108866/g.338182  ORF Transcript_108866/g.338182 Transcript_108866/m.338182 type:complete len:220 (-) Transcript_108866:325-984(-)
MCGRARRLAATTATSPSGGSRAARPASRRCTAHRSAGGAAGAAAGGPSARVSASTSCRRGCPRGGRWSRRSQGAVAWKRRTRGRTSRTRSTRSFTCSSSDSWKEWLGRSLTASRAAPSGCRMRSSSCWWPTRSWGRLSTPGRERSTWQGRSPDTAHQGLCWTRQSSWASSSLAASAPAGLATGAPSLWWGRSPAGRGGASPRTPPRAEARRRCVHSCFQ